MNTYAICIDIIDTSRKPQIRFLACYLPPDKSRNTESLEELCECIRHYNNGDLFYLLGDFNMPYIDWETLSSTPTCGKNFLDFLAEIPLFQQICEPTTKYGSLLDLLLCNEFSARNIQQIKIRSPITPTCDHYTVELLISNTNATMSSEPLSYVAYDKGDYNKINHELSKINWPHIFNLYQNNVQNIYDFFLREVHKLVKQHIPTNTHRRTTRPPRHVRKLAKKKERLYKKLKQDPTLKQRYKDLSARYSYTVQTLHNRNEIKICESQNLRKLYKFVNRKLKSSDDIPPIKLDTDEFIVDDFDKANAFNKTFQSVFTSDNGIPLNLQNKLHPNFNLNNITITRKMVLDVIKSLTPKKSKTPDDLPYILIKRISPAIIHFLVLLFNLSIQTGQIPLQWKTALVMPIYKKGSLCTASNYKPISLTSGICRIFEKIICAHMFYHLNQNKLISPSQHGFISQRSTITQLLKAQQIWLDNYSRNKTTSVVYTDLSKAFDRVSHLKLLEVLRSYGIDGNVHAWIKNFLGGRTQQVIINNKLSHALPVLSGVPQGSVIAPLMFIIFINDMAATCSDNTTACLFADDAKFFSTNPTDLQSSLNNISTFLKSRQLVLATEKCEKITFSKARQTHALTLEDVLLKESKIIKDLGITVSNDLQWNHHINRIKGQAFQRAHHILKSFKSNNIWTLINAYITFVRPLVEYGSTVWSPYLKRDILTIERVQRFFTKVSCMRTGISFSSYSDRLYKLNLKSLQYRRVEGDLILTFKIIHKLIDLPFEQLFSYHNTRYNTRSHKFTLRMPLFTTNLQKSFFASRVIPVWNKLPRIVVEANSLHQFKAELRKIDLHSYAELEF